MSNLTIDISKFSSKLWFPLQEAVFKAINEDEPSSWDLGGGAASGKTMIAHQLGIVMLLVLDNHIGLVYLYETEHKERITELFIKRLEKWGIQHTKKTNVNGTVKITLFNGSTIIISSTKGSSNASVEEKFKTPYTDDKNVAFIWFEEFTAIYNTMKSQKVYTSAISRLKRQCRQGHVIMHTYNPPDNAADPIIDWRMKKSNVTHQLITNMYGLPPRYQDKETIKAAEELKQEDELLWRNVYLGEVVGTSGLAFPNFTKYAVIDSIEEQIINYSVWIDNGTLHATVFELHGETINGQTILLDTWYHSGRLSGMKSSAQYIKDFKDWARGHNITQLTYIVTDDRDFQLLLREAGFKNVKWISEEVTKSVYQSYKITKLAIEKGVFKVLNTPNNNIVIQQFNNLTTTTKKYKERYRVIPKKTESGDIPESKTMHGVDPCLYKMLVTGKKLGVYKEGEVI